MEENNENKDCCPKMQKDESDDWTVAVLTAGFAMGAAATFAAIKLTGKLMEYDRSPPVCQTGGDHQFLISNLFDTMTSKRNNTDRCVLLWKIFIADLHHRRKNDILPRFRIIREHGSTPGPGVCPRGVIFDLRFERFSR